MRREGVVLARQRGATDVLALQGREAHRQLGQRDREDRDLGAVFVCAQLEAVERQPGFEAQRVAGAQAGRRSPAGHQRVPQRGSGLGRRRRARSRAARRCSRCGPRARSSPAAVTTESRLRSGSGSSPREIAADRMARESGPCRAIMAISSVASCSSRSVKRSASRAKCAQSLQPVGGVHDEQVLVGAEPVEIGVVDGAAGLVADDGVLRFADLEGGRVVGEHALQKGQRAGPADHEATHVGDVEQAGVPARGQVLGDDAAGVLDGHLPAGELDDPAAGGDVALVESRALELVAIVLIGRPTPGGRRSPAGAPGSDRRSDRP